MNRGAALLLVAVALLVYGIFGIDGGGTWTIPSYNTGLVLMPISLLLLIRAGWGGRPGGWILAAGGAFVGTWVLYELLRQGPCMTVASGIPFAICNAIPFREGAAPQLSGIVALILLVAGGVRLWQMAPGRVSARPPTT